MNLREARRRGKTKDVAAFFAPCMLAFSSHSCWRDVRSRRNAATLDLSRCAAVAVACARKLFRSVQSRPPRQLSRLPPRRAPPTGDWSPPGTAPHVARQPDPNAATATRAGRRGRWFARGPPLPFRSGSVACPQLLYTTAANRARPNRRVSVGVSPRTPARDRTGGISRATREVGGRMDASIGTVLAGDARRDSAAGARARR